jgi:hypothetical protein
MSLLRGKIGEATANASPFGSDTGTTGISATRTEKAPRVPIDPETALKAGLAVLGIGLLAAGYVVRWRTRGRTLRKPTQKQKEAIAEPLANILTRRLDLGRVGPDIIDLAMISIGVDDYVNDGDLIEGPRVEFGIPDDLREKENSDVQ